jgi:hypothetical protein
MQRIAVARGYTPIRQASNAIGQGQYRRRRHARILPGIDMPEPNHSVVARIACNIETEVNAPPAKAGGFGLRLEAGFDRPVGSIVRRP